MFVKCTLVQVSGMSTTSDIVDYFGSWLEVLFPLPEVLALPVWILLEDSMFDSTSIVISVAHFFV